MTFDLRGGSHEYCQINSGGLDVDRLHTASNLPQGTGEKIVSYTDISTGTVLKKAHTPRYTPHTGSQCTEKAGNILQP